MQAKPQQPTQFVTSLAAIGAAVLLARWPQMNRAEVRALMAHLAGEVCRRFAGRRIYVAAGHAQQRAARDVAIRKAFAEPGPDGAAARSPARTRQVAAQYGLTARHVRSILASKNPAPNGRSPASANH